jgi:hypothetical protein
MMKQTTSAPEIWCDFNGRMTERGHLPTQGTIKDLAALGLTLDAAVGLRFIFVMGDADKDGNPDDLLWNGTIVRDPTFGVLLEGDEHGYYWRSDLSC